MTSDPALFRPCRGRDGAIVRQPGAFVAALG